MKTIYWASSTCVWDIGTFYDSSEQTIIFAISYQKDLIEATTYINFGIHEKYNIYVVKDCVCCRWCIHTIVTFEQFNSEKKNHFIKFSPLLNNVGDKQNFSTFIYTYILMISDVTRLNAFGK